MQLEHKTLTNLKFKLRVKLWILELKKEHYITVKLSLNSFYAELGSVKKTDIRVRSLCHGL